MSDYDNFEDRLRAIADEISRSMQRMSEVDLEDMAERYGIDPDRARTFAGAAGRFLSGLSAGELFFGQSQAPGRETAPAPKSAGARGAAPHPLDLPTGPQGLALSALDSGRWTVRPGSNQLDGTGDGPPPPAAPDLVGELRARDWITADGTLTLVGRHALARWCRTAEDPAPRAPLPDVPDAQT